MTHLDRQVAVPVMGHDAGGGVAWWAHIVGFATEWRFSLPSETERFPIAHLFRMKPITTFIVNSKKADKMKFDISTIIWLFFIIAALQPQAPTFG